MKNSLPPHMHLTLSIAGHGHHPAAGRAAPLATMPSGFPRYDGLALQAQAGLFDAAFFVPSGAAGALQPDATPLIGSLVAPTRQIGLGASVPIASTEPFHTARAFAVLDGLSAGRTALLCDLQWTAGGDARFAHAASLPAEAHYERAEEYLDIASKLWDSWEDDAVVVDKPAGIFADADKIHAIHHVGTHFSVRGPLTAVRPVQGHPVIVVSDMSVPGLQLAAGFADVFVASCQSMGQTAALADQLRGQAARCGREPGALRILATISPILAGTDAEAQARAARLDALLDAEDASTAMPGLRFVGTAQGLCELMVAWQAAGACDGFNLAPAVLQDDVGQLVDGLIPQLQQRGLFRTAYGGATLREHLALPRPLNRFSGKPVHG